MENIKITLPQIPSLKIVLPGQGGTSITVDSEMSDTSENPVQNKVAKKYVDDGLLPKLEIWQSNTLYKQGAVVLAQLWHDEETRESVVLYCIKDTTETNISYPNEAKEFGKCWTAFDIVANFANSALSAVRDTNGNLIPEHYATKKELGDIETALDSIIAIQEGTTGGGNGWM